MVPFGRGAGDIGARATIPSSEDLYLRRGADRRAQFATVNARRDAWILELVENRDGEVLLEIDAPAGSLSVRYGRARPDGDLIGVDHGAR